MNSSIQDKEVTAPREPDRPQAQISRIKGTTRPTASSNSCSFNLHGDEHRQGAGRAPKNRAVKGGYSCSPFNHLSTVDAICEEAQGRQVDMGRSKTSKLFDGVLRAIRNSIKPKSLESSASNSPSNKRQHPSNPVPEPATKKARVSSAEPVTKEEGNNLLPTPARATKSPISGSLNNVLERTRASGVSPERGPTPLSRKRKLSTLDLDTSASPRKIVKRVHEYTPNPRKRKASISVDIGVVVFPRKRRMLEHDAALSSAPTDNRPATEAGVVAGSDKNKSPNKASFGASQGPRKVLQGHDGTMSSHVPKIEEQNPAEPDERSKNDSSIKEDIELAAEGRIKLLQQGPGIQTNTKADSVQDIMAQFDNVVSAPNTEHIEKEPGLGAGLESSQLGTDDMDPELQAALLASTSGQSTATLKDSTPSTEIDADTDSATFPTAYGPPSSPKVKDSLPYFWLPRGLENPRFACFQNAILQCLHALPTVRNLLSNIVDQPTERDLDNNLSEDEFDLCSWSHKQRRMRKSIKIWIESWKRELKNHLRTREEDGKLCLSQHLAALFSEMSKEEDEPIDKFLLQHVCGEVLDKPDFDAEDSFDGDSQEDAAAFLRQLLLRLDSENGQGTITRILDTEITCRRSCKKCGREKSFRQVESVSEASYRYGMKLGDVANSLFPNAGDDDRYAEAICEQCSSKGTYEDLERWERARAVNPSRNLIVNVSRDGNQCVHPTLNDIAVPATRHGRHFTARYTLRAVTVYFATHSEGDGGHYTALRKHGDRWFCCDDASVSEVSGMELTQRMRLGRVFFYERVDDR